MKYDTCITIFGGTGDLMTPDVAEKLFGEKGEFLCFIIEILLSEHSIINKDF